MNGIISLCHFCEMHGPSVLFCTQSFRRDAPQLTKLASAAAAAASDDGGDFFFEDLSPLQKKLSDALERVTKGTTSTASISSVDLDSLSIAETTEDQTSTTTSTELKTPPDPVSSKAAPQQQQQQQQNTCLSCSSLSEGESGFLSYEPDALTVYVSSRNPLDSDLYSVVRQACVRCLSIEFSPGREGPVLFGDEKSGFTFGFLFKLKDSHARGETRYYGFLFIMNDKAHLVSSLPFLISNFRAIAADIEAKASRLYDTETGQNRFRSDTHMSSRMAFNSLAPDQFRRRGTQALRSLVELVRIPDFFGRLHACCSWLLQLSRRRLFERQRTGPPLIGVFAAPEPFLPRSSHYSSSADEIDKERSFVEEHADQYRSIPQVQFDDLGEMSECFGEETFRAIVSAAVTGVQIVVRSDAYWLVQSVIKQLQALLPPQCCTVIRYTNEYQEPWKCNFLGICSSVVVPDEVDPIVIDMKHDSSGEDLAHYTNLHRDNAKLRHFHFRVSMSDGRRKRSVPSDPNVFTTTFAVQLEATLRLKPSSNMLDLHIILLKEEWINKTKTFYQIAHSNIGREQDEHVKAFLKAVGLKESDVSVLKFWILGLGKRHRASLLVRDDV